MPRKRAVNVCEFCHHSKIRCDVDVTKIPCSKCTEVGRSCIIRARKQYSKRKRLSPANISIPSTSPVYKENGSQRTRSALSKIVAASHLEPSPRTAQVFIGASGYSSILAAACENPGHHFRVPAAIEKILPAEDLEYLKAKGCFSLPTECRELLKAYFHYVHPTFPVIDASEFSRTFASGGLYGINLLLLWSMFSISASYIPLVSRKATKEEYVQRAKLLFDLSRENDKIVLVQSALLLSFWFVDTEDVKQSWYWTSVAFGIAQTLGLHRSSSAQIEQAQKRHWSNIWRCCMMRDVWLSFGMGRPLRLNAEDCDNSATRPEENAFEEMVLDGETLISTDEAVGFDRMWTDLIVVGDILRAALTSKASLFLHLQTVRTCAPVRLSAETTFHLTCVHWHLRLHQCAATITIARLCKDDETARIATDDTTALLQEIEGDDSAILAAPITIPLIVPAMVNNLEVGMKNALGQESGDIQPYIRFLSSVEDNYPAAAIIKRVFAATKETVAGRYKPTI